MKKQIIPKNKTTNYLLTMYDQESILYVLCVDDAKVQHKYKIE